MTVAFVTLCDLSNPVLRSGVPYYVARAMESINLNIKEIRIGDERSAFSRAISRWRQFFVNCFHLGRYDATWSIALSKSYASQLEHSDIHECSFVFSISSNAVAYLSTKKPIVLWLDNSFLSFTKYPGVDNLSLGVHKEALIVEEKAFKNCSILFTASEWLKNELLLQYPFLENKIFVLARGANLLERLSFDDVFKRVSLRMNDNKMRLLHICSGWWERKGGDLAVSIWEKLRQIVDVDLVIIGDVPAEKFQDLYERGVIMTGKINKNSLAGLTEFRDLVTACHYLLVPSVAEGFGIVYAEAASLGVPSIAFDVMGVSESVKNGVTGWLLPIDATKTQFVETIVKHWVDKKSYENICLSSAIYACNNFDWEKNVRTLKEKVISL
jgi:glycosyltransferase involved in cell wall biosynthesis